MGLIPTFPFLMSGIEYTLFSYYRRRVPICPARLCRRRMPRRGFNGQGTTRTSLSRAGRDGACGNIVAGLQMKMATRWTNGGCRHGTGAAMAIGPGTYMPIAVRIGFGLDVGWRHDSASIAARVAVASSPAHLSLFFHSCFYHQAMLLIARVAPWWRKRNAG